MEVRDKGVFPHPQDSPVVVLDDDESFVWSVTSFLSRQGYPTRGHLTAAEALADLDRSPASLFVVDLVLGQDHGIEVAREALELDPTLAVIVVTGRGSEASAVECLRLGASDYLSKPFELEDFGRSVQRALMRRSNELRGHHREETLRSRIDELQKQQRAAAIRALGEIVWSLEAKHDFLRGHSVHVADLAEGTARELGLPDARVQLLRLAGHVHDVGMIAAPDEALHHRGSLDADDLEKVRGHTILGAELARAFGLYDVAECIEFHHERLDGSGYPHGLKGSQIPVEALIVGIAEVYSALTEDRPFREASSAAESIAILRGVEGVWFPAGLVDALERAVGSVPSEVG